MLTNVKMPFSIDLGLVLSLYVPYAYIKAVVVCKSERFKLFFYLTYNSCTFISQHDGVILLQIPELIVSSFSLLFTCYKLPMSARSK